MHNTCVVYLSVYTTAKNQLLFLINVTNPIMPCDRASSDAPIQSIFVGPISLPKNENVGAPMKALSPSSPYIQPY